MVATLAVFLVVGALAIVAAVGAAGAAGAAVTETPFEAVGAQVMAAPLDILKF